MADMILVSTMKTRNVWFSAISCAMVLAGCVDDSTEELAAEDAQIAPFAGTMLVHVYYGSDERLAELTKEIDVLEHADREAGYVAALIEADEYERLVDEGLHVEVQDQPSTMLQQILGLGGFRSIPNYACYRTVEETNDTMTTLAASHGDLVSLVDMGDSWDKAAAGGAAGYDLQGMIITNQAIPGPKPRLFLMAAIHARELATAELAIRFAEHLVDQYGVDPDITWMVDHYELHVLPHTNPDGRKIAELGYTQRKNVNDTLGTCANPPTASSQKGIDLNRNFPFQYGGAGTSTDPCNLTYRGTGAASEVETQAVRDYVSSIFADQRGPGLSDPAPATTTGVLISLHSYSPLVLYPWSWGASEAPNLAGLRTLGRKFGYHNNYPICQGPLCLYAASGSTDDWSYGELGIASYTFEIGTSFFQDCASFESTIYPDNLDALLTAFKAARRPYQTPAGPDVVGGAVSASPVTAGTAVTLTATADDTRFDSNGWGNEPTQPVVKARYSVDQPSWTGAPLTRLAAADGSFGTSVEGLTASIDTSGWAPGRYTLFVEGRDALGNWGAPSAVFLDVEAAGAGVEVCGGELDEDGDTLVDCADSDCLGTPACATVEACTDTVDDDGDGDVDCADADCWDALACAPPPEVCNDSVDNDGDTYVDCNDGDCSGSPSCPVVINTTNFESGWGFYVDGGVDASLYAFNGTTWGRIQDNSGVDSSFYSNAFNLSGASSLKIDYTYYASSMENGEDYFIELYDGVTWQVLANYKRGTDFNNGVTYNKTITVTSAAFNFGAAAQLRFRNDASDNSDLILIDNVTLTKIP